MANVSYHCLSPDTANQLPGDTLLQEIFKSNSASSYSQPQPTFPAHFTTCSYCFSYALWNTVVRKLLSDFLLRQISSEKTKSNSQKKTNTARIATHCRAGLKPWRFGCSYPALSSLVKSVTAPPFSLPGRDDDDDCSIKSFEIFCLKKKEKSESCVYLLAYIIILFSSTVLIINFLKWWTRDCW